MISFILCYLAAIIKDKVLVDSDVFPVVNDPRQLSDAELSQLCLPNWFVNLQLSWDVLKMFIWCTFLLKFKSKYILFNLIDLLALSIIKNKKVTYWSFYYLEFLQ